MKQILIRYDDPITEDEAIEYVRSIFRHDNDRKGLVVFHDGTALLFSDRSKHIAITIERKSK